VVGTPQLQLFFVFILIFYLLDLVMVHLAKNLILQNVCALHHIFVFKSF
jgi:hypothetical protein